ncbi:MAG: IS3 family transposase [Erysipelothrix sp.]|nr:IS3 family transposase [Erysipelothrix sp.]
MGRNTDCLDIRYVYGEETTFKDIHESSREIEEYIVCYNYNRIKSNLRGLSPVQCRNQILEIN